MSARHTAGPLTYFVGNSNGRGLIRIETAHDAPIAGIHIASMPRGDQSKADADFLVHAANCHAELLDGIRKARAVAASPQSFDLEEVERDFAALIAHAEGGQS